MMGKSGESFTRELLVGRGFGCQWARRPMEHRNIDHVAVSPHAVLAIETKFVGAGRQWGTTAYRESGLGWCPVKRRPTGGGDGSVMGSSPHPWRP
jgi:hypothetical protein